MQRSIAISNKSRTLTYLSITAALFLLLASCGETGTDDDAATTTSGDSSTTTEETTTSSTGPPDDTTTTTTSPEGPLGATERCSNPEGFSISYPADWAVNDGGVTAPCSQFNPEPFEVPEASDARVAAITAFVDDVPFADVAAPEEGSDQMSATTSVDGHQAVRLSGTTGDDGLYPAGTPVTRYVIDLSLGVDDGPGTLFVDVIGVGDVDFEEATRVLDLMVPTIDLEGDDIEEADPATVARYEGGGTPIVVLASVDDGNVCLRLDVAEGSSCVALDVDEADADIRTVRLGTDVQSVFAGIAADDVFRIEAQQAGGTTLSYLPVTVDDAGVGGWALPVGRDDITEVVWFDLDGGELGRRTIEDGGSDEGPDAIGDFTEEPIVVGDFPAGGEPFFLTDVRFGANDGFDRIVFQLIGGTELAYRVEFTDEAVKQPSGQPLDLEGEMFVAITMTPASRVDLSGPEPEISYDGPLTIAPGSGAVVKEIGLVEDFENVMTWTVGVDDGARIATDLLENPTRVVVDIAPPAG